MAGVPTRSRRKDGSRSKRYVCRAHREQPVGAAAYCAAAPVDAAVVDAAFVANLTHFLGDVEGWRDRLVQSRDAERARMRGEGQRAGADLVGSERAVERLGAEYARQVERGESEDADAVREVLKGQRAERDLARRRLDAARAAHAATVTDDGEDFDPLLDFYGGLQEELAGRVEDARGDLRRLNAAVREFFEEVRLRATADGVELLPVLSADAVARILARPGLWPHAVTPLVGGRPVALLDPWEEILDAFRTISREDPAAAAALAAEVQRVRERAD